MDNGQHLTIGHWSWLMKQSSRATWSERERRLIDELAWLRRESPSAAVIEHIEKLQEERSRPARERAEEELSEAIMLLESLRHVFAPS